MWRDWGAPVGSDNGNDQVMMGQYTSLMLHTTLNFFTITVRLDMFLHIRKYPCDHPVRETFSNDAPS